MPGIDPGRFFAANADRYTEWRRLLHQYPEVGFQEFATANFIEEKLRSFGIEEVGRVTETGVVAVVNGNSPGPRVGLRADIDALPLVEEGGRPHRSRNPGIAHACGHDGHTTMLLAAAEYLAAIRDFPGTVVFIFQPAEEATGGGKVMVTEGLFDRYPVDAVFGMHNWPNLPLGQVAVQPGAMMSAMDLFSIRMTGDGVHAALPHLGSDTIVAAAAVIGAIQTIVSRATDPHEALVISLTQIHGGQSLNALPTEVELTGTLRSFSLPVRERALRRLAEIVDATARAYGVEGVFTFQEGYPATLNDADLARFMGHVASGLDAPAPRIGGFAPSMASEDFAFMLQARPGAYAWIGNGTATPLHSPSFDFNDALIPIGAAYWVELASRFVAGEQDRPIQTERNI